MADIIRLARDKVIEDSRKDAILFLDLQNHIVGQQWQVRYYRDEDQTEIDTLVAIGIRNGTGSECYKVISYGTATAIVSITETLPDVSQMVHGEIYIVKVDDIWNYVTVTDDTRRFDPIVGGPYAYFNLEDGHVWFYTEHNLPETPQYPGTLRRDDDFYTREEMDEFMVETLRHLRELDSRSDEVDRILQEHREELDFDAVWLKDLDSLTFPLTVSVTASPGATTWASGTSHDITFTFTAKKVQRLGLVPEPKPETEPEINVTQNCKFYYKLSTESNFHEITGSSVTVQGVTATNKTLTYNFKGGNVEEYGRIKSASNISYNFGYRFLYGATSGTLTNIDSLTQSSLMMKSTYYSAAFTTTLSNLATFALPVAWGDITKVTDSGGVMDYTTSFTKIGTFTRTVDGQSVSYNVWRWSSLPTVVTNFTYRFYN
jgi:hypothetical protein